MNYSSEPSVLILMGTLNGEKYIREQLDSIAAQTHKNWRIIISDDGSTDRTLEIARQWLNEVGKDRVVFRTGPQKGFAQNFLSMACETHFSADYYFFCDQDDVWLNNKIESVLEFLTRKEKANTPCLYFGKVIYIDEDSRIYSESTVPRQGPSFENALIQCIAGGNTMAFNKNLKNLLTKVGMVYPVSHDWWLYQLVCGVGGCAFYDPKAYVLYRQHQASLVGGNRSLSAKLKRLRQALRGQFIFYTAINLECLEKAAFFFTPNQVALFRNFHKIKNLGLPGRFFGIMRLGIHRQKFSETIIFYLLLLLKKV